MSAPWHLLQVRGYGIDSQGHQSNKTDGTHVGVVVERRRGSCGQSISNNEPSRVVILSESEESLARQRFFALAQNDNPPSASFDSQHVFEMDWPWWPPDVPVEAG